MKHSKAILRRNTFPGIESIHHAGRRETFDDNLPHVSMLSILNIDNIRKRQRAEGNFDCFGKATAGYCDQVNCAYYSECLNICVVLRSLG